MTTTNERATSGYSMLDLFRVEVETQAVILNENLAALKNNPSSNKELEVITRTTHAIKGAARLVEVEAAAELAEILENCLQEVQKQRISLASNQIDWLLRGVDLLVNISRVEEGDRDRWLSEHQEEIGTTSKGIASLFTPGAEPMHPATIPTSQPTVAISEPPPPPPPPVKPISLNTATDSAPPVAPVAPPEDPGASMGDTSMLELFRMEVEAQSSILNNGLLALESQPDSLKELEALMRAAHSIKGAARIVAIDAAVNLAHVMEDCFVAAQKQTITLNADSIDVLLQGVDSIVNLSKVEPENLNNWISEHGQAVETLRQQLAALLSPDAVPRLPQAAPTPPPPPPSPTPSAEKTTDGDGKTLAAALSTVAQEQVPVTHSLVSQQQASPVAKQLIESKPPTSQDTEQPTSTKDRVVQVSGDNLNRIMGLAGESLIEANWLQPFADSLTLLKKRQQELAKILENLQNSIGNNYISTEGEDYLKAARVKEQECRQYLSDRLDSLELFARRNTNLSDRLYREVIASHMRPFADGVQSFPRMLRDIARKLGKQVKFDIIGKTTPVDRDILQKLEAPLTHILRNAVDHGLELPEERLAVGKPAEGTIRLEALHRGGMLAITITDDGKGMHPEHLRQKIINKKLATPEMAAQLSENELLEFLFLPGFSTASQVTEISGRGVGLDIAKSMAQEVGGTVRAASQPGKGMSFFFQLPLTLSVIRTLLVEIAGEVYAFPLARVEQLVMVSKDEISVVENRQYFTSNGEHIGLVAAYQVLELQATSIQSEALPVVIIGDQSNHFGIVVDQFLGERDLVVRPLDSRLGKVPDLSAAAVMEDGTPVLIVDVLDMVRSIDNLLNSRILHKVTADGDGRSLDKYKRILVVDDSITVREMERKLLENKGYKVEVAVDGMDGWNAVRTNDYDLVISDVDMPRMNGIEFVSLIKKHPKLYSTPVIIVSYKDQEEHRIQGLEAGADYYLTKSSFQDDTLIKAVVDLVGN